MKPAPPAALLPFVTERYSPMRFDADYIVTNETLDVILDAARRSPSAGNSQPWAFIVGRRHDSVHQRLVRHLARSSSAWAPDASVLIANLTRLYVDDSDFEFSEFSHYDTGQAVAHLTFQALAFGLQVHQFRAFDREAVQAEFSISPSWEVTSMAAVGRPAAGASQLTGAGTDRTRRSLEAITWARIRE